MFGPTKKQVLGHLGYQNADIETLARLVSLGRLDLSRSISRVIPLEDIAEGIEMFERRGDPIRILGAALFAVPGGHRLRHTGRLDGS